MSETRTPRKVPKRKEEIVSALSEEIRSLPGGARLPSTSELCARFHCAIMTVMRALDKLEQRGEIVRRHGKGTFVSCRELREIYVLVPAPGGRWSNDDTIYDQILQEARRRGITAHLIYATTDNVFYHVDRSSLECIPPGGAVIVTNHWYHRVFRFLQERRCNVVFFDTFGDQLSVQMDAEIVMGWQRLIVPIRESIGEAVRRLAAKKHRNILFLHRSVHSGTIQISAFREALRRENIPVDPAWEIYGDYQILYDVLDRRLHELPGCNAILASTPFQAEVAMTALAALRRRIPQDCSLVCLRDHPRLMAGTPPVTVVDYLPAAAADKALDMLASARSGPRTESLDYEVHERGSI